MRTINVQLFAGVQHMVGQKTIAVVVGDKATVGDLRDRVVADHPVLEPFMSTLVCAINDEMVTPEHVLGEGERVELIPPIAGGGDAFPAIDRKVIPS